MASRTAFVRVAGAAVAPATRGFSRGFSRSFQTSARRLSEAAPLPARKPVGAFRGGLFGFLLGASLTGAGVYYYVLQEYKASNDQLTDDIYALQKATQTLSTHIATIEDRVQAGKK